MAARNSPDPIELDPADESDVPVYLPGTPTLGFTRVLERLFNTLFR
ncbi:hypothetical protein [Natronorubrum sulfidifaciens]|uniref:Uncharacterized protein n=1 Tax=Natronorubrum sulfidifaciens JCM 14089 TaxID=1230460 RepID=L9WBP1_9EURY|nr:hypothetical protein [Natronorubrum sulfidifaciens]ELY46777.1 hypothetical protein C495_06703 [Natronorubrum sulfidifaciens JCM 14089]